VLYAPAAGVPDAEASLQACASAGAGAGAGAGGQPLFAQPGGGQSVSDALASLNAQVVASLHLVH
jgi:hypothetical protein